MSGIHSPMTIFIERLKMIADLPRDIGHALEGIVSSVKVFAANQDIVSHGDRPSQVSVVLEGWVCRNKVLPSGKRQITALHFAGVTPDLQSLFVPCMDHNITTLTNGRVAFIPHARLRELMATFPTLAHAFWQETVLEAAISREWEVNLGARHAETRIAHLFCEMATRLERFGWANRSASEVSFAWPLTQAHLADATGLSVVHVNRSIQALRGAGLLELTREKATILDMEELERFSDFNADYLLAERPRRHTAESQAEQRA
jgi:CRP-like cAMP-binding protein